MAEKILNTRILLKTATLEEWNSSTLPLKKGEIAIATVAATAGNGLTEPVCMLKIGTAEEKTFSELPWSFYAKSSDVIAAAKSEDTLRTFINGVIADAGIASSSAMEALSGRVTTAEGEIDTLQSEMDAVEAKAAANEADIATLEGLVGDTKVADQITAAINALNLAGTYEAKGEAAKVQSALDTYKTSNDAAVLANTNAISANTNAITAIKDGTTLDSFADVETALAGKEASGAAAQALADAKTYADGLAGNYDAKGAAATAEANAKSYADGLAGNYDAKGDAAQALTDAKAYTDSEMTRLVGDKTVGTQIEAAITGLDLANTYAAKSHKHVKADITDFAHNHEMGEVNGLSNALAGKEEAGAAAAALAEAKSYADGKDAAIEAAQAAADKAQEEVDALETYVGTIPEGYTESNVIAYINKKAQETLDAASGGSSESAASVLAALNTYKAENDPKVTANTEAIAALEELVGDDKVSDQIAAVTNPLAGRVAAIEGDYLKAADKTELQGQITANANAIELLTNGVSAEEVDGVNDLIQYVKDHGTEVTGMKADIKANADAIDAIEADYLKAADKNELAGQISGLDTRMGAAETAIATKAAQADLEALAGRVTTVEGDLNAETTGLKAKMAAAEADIDELEALVGDTEVATQISDAIDAALKIDGVDKYALASALTAAIEQHNTDKAALEASIAAKADASELSAVAKSGNVNDLVQTTGDVLIFDCGGAN